MQTILTPVSIGELIDKITILEIKAERIADAAKLANVRTELDGLWPLWLQQQDAHRDAVLAVLREAYGDAAHLWFQRWRMFWMACAELFGYAGGEEWGVAHYLFERP